jgi:hypothetical protein
MIWAQGIGEQGLGDGRLLSVGGGVVVCFILGLSQRRDDDPSILLTWLSCFGLVLALAIL